MAEQAVTIGEFRVGSVLGRSFSILFKNIVPFGLLSVVVMAPTYIFAIAVNPMIYLGESGSPMVTLAINVIETLLSYLVYGALVYGTFQELRGRRASLGDCFSRGMAVMFPIFGVAIVVGLLTGLATLALVIPGLIVATMLWVAIPAAVIEKTGLSSLARSSELTKGHRWKVFFIIVLLFIFGFVLAIGVITGATTVAVATASNGGSWTISVVALLLVTAFVTALSAVVSAVGYHDLRVAKEGVDVEQIAAVFD